MGVHMKPRRMTGLRDSERADGEPSTGLLHDDDSEKIGQDNGRWNGVSLETMERDPLDPLPSMNTPRPGLLSHIADHFVGGPRRIPGELLYSGFLGKSPPASSLRRFGYQTFISALLFLLPSFVRARFFPTSSDRQPWRPHPTGYLDGLRGLAALFVFFFHTTNNLYNNVMFGYGAPGDEQNGENYHFLQLPFIKVLYAGPAAVSVFFIVSGFALSLKPIKQMRGNDDAGLLTTLNSAVFRRPLRLFLPCFISTFCVFLAIELGLFESTRFIAEDPSILTGRAKVHIHREGTFMLQLQHWWQQAISMPNIFGWSTDEFQGFFSYYDTHLWTIPIELRASLALFLTHIAFARFKPSTRIALTLLCCYWSIHEDRWEMLLFWSGMILCELSLGLCAPSRHFPDSSSSTAPSRSLKLTLYKILLLTNFISGLYFLSYPNERAESTPGFRTLSTLIPQSYHQKKRFWQGIGAAQLVFSVACYPPFSRLFSSAVPHYLGQISFALYLVHATVNHTVGYWLFWIMYNVTGGWETPGKKSAGFVVVLVLDTIVSVWAADVFWRAADRPSVRFARWLEGLCFRGGDGR